MSEIKICDTEKGKIEYLLEGKGPVVLIVHGGHDSCRGDYMKQSLLDRNFSVLIPSRPGYRGTPLNGHRTAESTAHLFYALLEKLRIKQVILIGNSAGGPVSLQFAQRYPDAVKKLVLEAAVVKPWFHKLTVQYYGTKIIFRPKRQARFWQGLREKLAADPEKTLAKNLKLFTKLKPKEVLGKMTFEDIELLKRAMVTGNDSGEGFVNDVEHRAGKISGISCPSLIIHSRKDASVPFSHAEYAHKMIKGSVLYEAPCDSHFLYLGPGSAEVMKRRIEFIWDENSTLCEQN